MNKIDQYIHAATRNNTRRAYQSALNHFEVTWGGFLPATSESIARYLVDHAETLSINTLKQRLSALAQWHIDQGFPDPTKTPFIKKILKGIKEVHPSPEKQAKPIQLEQINQLVVAIDHTITQAASQNEQTIIQRQLRNKALVLIGFWRGFRSDELSRLQIEHIQVEPGKGMSIFLPRSKGDRLNQGQWYKVPALSKLCPVNAYLDWVHGANIQSGPVFRRINRWGHMAEESLNPNSMIMLLRKMFTEAGLDDPDSYSSHSLRRGFATWANSRGWDVKSLMEYVGWKDMKSAMRYIDNNDGYSRQKIESGLPDNLT